MDRRSFFATLFGGIGAALWPYPPKPIICEKGRPWWELVSPEKIRTRFGWRLESLNPDCVSFGVEPATKHAEARFYMRWDESPSSYGTSSVPLNEVLRCPDGETLAYRPIVTAGSVRGKTAEQHQPVRLWF